MIFQMMRLNSTSVLLINNWNTGNRNTGDGNTGDWNTGDGNTGFFNTEDHKIYIFNQPSKYTQKEFFNTNYYSSLISKYLILTEWVNYTEAEKENDKAKELIGGYLKYYDFKGACKTWWNELTDENKKIILSIPMFDKKIFEEITDIKV